jgi:hypothetical protein
MMKKIYCKTLKKIKSTRVYFYFFFYFLLILKLKAFEDQEKNISHTTFQFMDHILAEVKRKDDIIMITSLDIKMLLAMLGIHHHLMSLKEWKKKKIFIFNELIQAQKMTFFLKDRGIFWNDHVFEKNMKQLKDFGYLKNMSESLKNYFKVKLIFPSYIKSMVSSSSHLLRTPFSKIFLMPHFNNQTNFFDISLWSWKKNQESKTFLKNFTEFLKQHPEEVSASIISPLCSKLFPHVVLTRTQIEYQDTYHFLQKNLKNIQKRINNVSQTEFFPEVEGVIEGWDYQHIVALHKILPIELPALNDKKEEFFFAIALQQMIYEYDCEISNIGIQIFPYGKKLLNQTVLKE